MTERVPEIDAALDGLVPSFAGADVNWDSVLQDSRPARRSLVFALALATLAVVFGVLPGLGIGRSVLWFGLDPGDLTHTIVATGTSPAAGPWELRASGGNGRDVCIELLLSNRQGAKECGPTTGMIRWFTYLDLGAAGPSQFIVGPADRAVTRIDVELANGRTLQAKLVDASASDDLDRSLQFYFLELAPEDTVTSVAAYDSTGKELGRLPVMRRP